MDQILRDLTDVLKAVPETETQPFLDGLVRARRVFMYGVGRSGLAARMFGMRLVHLGRDSTIVGDTTTPAIRADDMLVVCSRTGQSPILLHAVDLAHREAATVAAVVGMKGTPLAGAADLVVRIPLEMATAETRQPMGSLFEQALLLYLDRVVLSLMAALERTAEDMERIHSNLP